MLSQERVAVATDDDAQSLHDKLAALGARMIVAALPDLAVGRLRAVPQPESGVTYARKLEKQETQIDWQRPAAHIARLVRALRPAPGAVARLRGEPLKIWRAQQRPQRGDPGAVITSDSQGVLVGCGEDSLLITEMQRSGGKRLAAAEFLRGCPIAPGERLQ